MSWKLNKNSPILGQPEHLNVELRQHQLAMFYKCLTIEKAKSKYGFMADKAGTGKTLVLVSLIIADKMFYGKTQNLIIVPQNIIAQWTDEIKKYTGDYLTVKQFVNYSDITTLIYRDSDTGNGILNQYDILITTDLYHDTIMSFLEFNGTKVNRIIYDEIDTLNSVIKKYEEKEKAIAAKELEIKKKNELLGVTQKRLIPKAKKLGVNTTITWFVSASLSNLIDETKGFEFSGVHFPIDKISTIMVKCDNTFIDESNFKLEPPNFITYRCNSLIDDYSHLLSVDQLDHINSTSFSSIKYKSKNSKNEKEALQLIVTGYYDKIITLENGLNILKEKIDAIGIRRNDSTAITTEQKNLERDIVLYTKLFNKFYDVHLGKQGVALDTKEKYKELIQYISSVEISKQKLDEVKSVINSILSSNKDSKILIFSDFSESFKNLREYFQEQSVKYSELNKGNLKEVKEAIDQYKNGDTSILFLDSASSVAGTNLENSTHIIFLHRTNETLMAQMIGRSQRPGRTSVLNVINFYNNNEII